jgi:hypothetical protein
MKPTCLRWLRLALLLCACFTSAACPAKFFPMRFYFVEPARPDSDLEQVQPAPEPATPAPPKRPRAGRLHSEIAGTNAVNGWSTVPKPSSPGTRYGRVRETNP